MARMIYGLQKVMRRNDLSGMSSTELSYEMKVLATERNHLDFIGAVRTCLYDKGVDGKLVFDPLPKPKDLTEQFFRAYVNYTNDPEDTDFQQIIEWGQQNTHLPEVQKLYAVAKEMKIIS
ncbi:hypothetical protein [Simkania sp.]|uniref:hypothetical protein n=1 Tax=Simkania sp. TaxID=34094 RepID=UPI003B52B163